MGYEQHRDKAEYFHLGMNRSGVHFHRSIELLYCIGEQKDVYIDGEHTVLHQGDFLILPPFTVHHFPLIEGQKSLCVVMPVKYSELYASAVGTSRMADLVFLSSDLTRDIFEQLLKLEKVKNYYARDGIYRYVLGCLLENCTLVESGEKKKDSFAARVLTYLEEHYVERLTLETVATELGYNRCYFSTVFKKFFHVGFCEYLSSMRVEKSLPLLDENSVNEVAMAVGFGSVQNYYIAFKKEKGMSPAVYQKERS